MDSLQSTRHSVNRGEVHSYLGMTWDYSLTGRVKIVMEKYVQDDIDGYKVVKQAKTTAVYNSVQKQ